MIIIEFGLLDDLTQLMQVKTIDKMQKVRRPIKVNKNVADVLLDKDYIRCVRKNYYDLTKKGEAAKLLLVKVQYTLDNFLQITDITKLALRILKIDALPSVNLMKVYDMCCHACGTVVFGPPFYVEDIEGYKGNYCGNCIKDLGYLEASKRARAKYGHR